LSLERFQTLCETSSRAHRLSGGKTDRSPRVSDRQIAGVFAGWRCTNCEIVDTGHIRHRDLAIRGCRPRASLNDHVP
jgi:hypothetical protein